MPQLKDDGGVAVLADLMQISAVGAGLLLGSALVIILPEGFEAAMHADEVWAADQAALLHSR